MTQPTIEVQPQQLDPETSMFVALEHLEQCAKDLAEGYCPQYDAYPRATTDEGKCYLRGYHDYKEGHGWCGPDSGGVEMTCAVCGNSFSVTLY